MAWLEHIRNKPEHVKMRIIWTTVGVVAAVLIIIWALAARYQKNLPKDQTLMQTIGQGVHNVKENLHK